LEISFPGIVWNSSPINDELSFAYTLVPLSTFSVNGDFLDDEDICVGCWVILGNVPQVSLLLDLLHIAGLGARYWGGFLSRRVDFGLLGRTQP